MTCARRLAVGLIHCITFAYGEGETNKYLVAVFTDILTYTSAGPVSIYILFLFFYCCFLTTIPGVL